jgi:hypothetical protein
LLPQTSDFPHRGTLIIQQGRPGMKPYLAILAAAAATLLLQPATALAENEPNVVRSYLVVAKPGAMEELHQGLREHGRWRLEHGESWDWFIYSRVAGEGHPGTYVIRSFGHRWADLDAYEEFNQAALPHYMQTVAPHTMHSEAHLHVWDAELSNWPEDAGPHSLFWVYAYQLKSGTVRAARAALEQILGHMKAGGWNEVFGWEWTTTGSSSLSLVVPSADWAGFDGPQAYQVLVEQVGENAARELWAAFFDHVKKMESSVWREVPELRVTVQR